MQLNEKENNWFLNILLPVTFWNYMIRKTKYKATLDKLKLELSKCADIKIFKNQLTEQQFNLFKNKAEYLCRLFQLTSSQVEGRK